MLFGVRWLVFVFLIVLYNIGILNFRWAAITLTVNGAAMALHILHNVVNTRKASDFIGILN